jgi:folate-dependent phosphoribosylglycinamide formyltransferase PurN
MKIGWFSSGRGPGSQALLAAACEAVQAGRLPVEIAYVFCNRARGEFEPADRFLELAESYGLPVVTLSSSSFRRTAKGEVARAGHPLPPWRIDYDNAVLRLLQQYQTDTAVLAGYQLIAPELCRHLNLINLHPAAPGGPVGLWQDVIWQLIDSKASVSGVTMFLATPELDAGPPISFCTYGLRDEQTALLWRDAEKRKPAVLRNELGEQAPLFLEIRRRGAAREAPLMLATIAALALGRIRIAGGEIVDTSGRPAEAIDLSSEVDKAIEPSL